MFSPSPSTSSGEAHDADDASGEAHDADDDEGVVKSDPFCLGEFRV